MAMVLEELVVNFLFKGDRKGLKKLEQDIDRGVASVKRELKPVTRALTTFEGKAKDALRKAGLAVEDFSDETAEMSREARRDFDRVGREADELGRDMADLSQKTERELGQAERAMDDFADKAQRTSGTVGTALGAIASAFAIKDAGDFRAELARIDNQLENLNFKQVETAVLAVSDAFGVNKDIVAEFARQIPNELAGTPEEFVATLERSVKLFKARGRDTAPIELQDLLNIGNLRLPPELRDSFAEQLNRLIADNPVLHDSLNELGEGLTEALSGKITLEDQQAAIVDFFALLHAGVTKAGRDIANLSVSELERDIRAVMEQGFTREEILHGPLPEGTKGLSAGSEDFLKLLWAEGNALKAVNQAREKYTSGFATLDADVHNITQASGGLAGILVWLDNLIARVSGTVLEIGGAFVGLLPAMGGAALTLQSLGFDLSTLRTTGIPVLTAFRTASLSAFAPLLTVSGPVLLIVAAIAAAALLIYKYWEPLAVFFQGLMIGMGEALASFEDFFAEALAPLQPLFSWLKALLAPAEGSAEELAAVGNTARRLGKIIGTVLLLPLYILSALLWAVTKFLSMLTQGFFWLIDAIAAANQALEEWAAPLSRWFAEHSPAEAFMMAWEGIVDFVSDLFGDVFNTVVAGVEKITGWLTDNPIVAGISWLGDKLGLNADTRKGLAAFGTPAGAGGVPALDTGGIVSRPTLAALALNSRPEAILPLDRLGGFLRDLGEMTAQAMAPPLIGPVRAPALASAAAGPVTVTKHYSFHWDALNVSVEHGDPDEIAATVGRALEQQLHNVVEDFDDDVER